MHFFSYLLALQVSHRYLEFSVYHNRTDDISTEYKLQDAMDNRLFGG